VHEYIIGATRSGKTNHILDTIEEPFCLLDKHGNAARELADAYPCIYWRPAGLSHPTGYNPLQNVPPDQRWRVTADIVSLFSDIWGLGEQTPRLLYYLRATLRLLLDNPNTTLLDIRRVLSDAHYRNALIRKCADRETLQTWLEFSHQPPKTKQSKSPPSRTKPPRLQIPCPYATSSANPLAQ
jgi:hypothetical protein